MAGDGAKGCPGAREAGKTRIPALMEAPARARVAAKAAGRIDNSIAES